jgi:hypothetical protein
MSSVLPFPASSGPSDPSFDLSDVIHEVCEAWESRCFHQGLHVEADVPPYTLLHGDRNQFRLIVELVLAHVVDVAPRGTDLVMAVHHDEDSVEIEVADSGTGSALRWLPTGAGAEPGVRDPRRSPAVAELRGRVAALGGELRFLDDSAGGAVIRVRFPPHSQCAAA